MGTLVGDKQASLISILNQCIKVLFSSYSLRLCSLCLLDRWVFSYSISLLLSAQSEPICLHVPVSWVRLWKGVTFCCCCCLKVFPNLRSLGAEYSLIIIVSCSWLDNYKGSSVCQIMDFLFLFKKAGYEGYLLLLLSCSLPCYCPSLLRVPSFVIPRGVFWHRSNLYPFLIMPDPSCMKQQARKSISLCISSWLLLPIQTLVWRIACTFF